ncbi:rhamnogalacturonidase [Flectobacillus roseus]|uniref:Glycosyl hydrolase family 28 protein n=1 Tax=Flectobacillus roseus TaxID=502259 RepID=A0ABT6Y7B1_9BACT|nr:glycosyl hydrolase family 28 protein [Flectobacillus roseus]MDI9859411.1 glycosyl hydrolase family 28 protein [Flectobacillus roseus]
MKKILLALAFSLVGLSSINAQKNTTQLFPDGTPISSWFTVNKKITLPQLGKAYVITDYGVKNDSTLVQTEAIQKIIDMATEKGGVIVIPKGTFLSGALFFKPKTHLHVVEGGKLKGSDNIENYPKLPSRMEGQSLDYFTALVNAYQVDGFTISGKGTIDGNGLKYWQAFWQRRKENPNCTNLEVSRPRLVFIWKSNNVQIQDVKLHNSGFWTTHLYQCNNVKILDAHIFSPEKPVKAPSTDAIDIDACINVLVKGCYLSVNDDAIALKGGKGPWADKVPNNGANKNIIIEDCEFGFCHSALTCGSEAIHNRNIIMRKCYVNEATRVLWLKMRPDTPQLYEYILVENVKGNSHSLLFVKPWKQFFDLQGRKDVPLSYSDHVTLKNIEVKCDIFYDVAVSEYDKLSNFTFENFKVESKNPAFDKSVVKGFTLKNVVVNGVAIK